MFEESLKEKFEKIFKIAKVTFDSPGENREQGCLFIEIESSRNVIKDKRQKAMVTGQAFVAAQNDQLPFGFFSKAIKEADNSLTKDLFFFDIEANTLRKNNLVERGFGFTYFFDSQYDPEVGTIDSVTINVEEQ